MKNKIKKDLMESRGNSVSILKKNVSAIHINAKLSLLQRKLVNALVYNAYENLLSSETHSIGVAILSEMIGFDSNNIDYMKGALKGMVETTIEWDLFDDDNGHSWEVASLLSWAKISDGVCKYRYDKALSEKFYHPDVYSKINLSVVKNMKSVYALALYENCLRFLDIGKTGWWDLPTFRCLLGVDNEGVYSQFKFLNRDLIKPSIKEINSLSDISLECETRKKGRSIVALRFLVKRNRQLSLLRNVGSKKDGLLDNQTFQKLLSLGVSESLGRYWFQEYGEEYIEHKIDYMLTKSMAGQIQSSKIGFLKSAVENNFVSDQEADYKRKIEFKKIQQERERKQEEIERKVKLLKDISKAHGISCVEKIENIFSSFNQEKQKNIKDQFIQNYLKRSFEISDFKKNGWSSLLARKNIFYFWGKDQGISLPAQIEFAREFGVKDFDQLKKDAKEAS